MSKKKVKNIDTLDSARYFEPFLRDPGEFETEASYDNYIQRFREHAADLISQEVQKVRIDELEYFADKVIGKILAHAGVPNHFVYVAKDARIAELAASAEHPPTTIKENKEDKDV